MNDYKSYMDRVNVSEELHEKLMALERGKKEEKPMKWRPYIAAAACAALLIGVGVWRVGARPEEERWRDLVATFETSAIESTQISDPDPVQCAAPSPPDVKTIGGYEVQRGETVVYYYLPWIDYGSQSEAAAVALDWDIPQNAARRDLSTDEIVALLGGADAVDLHLDWSAYELTGWGAWYEDGSFWGAYLMGSKGPMDHFEFAVTAGQLPPTCIAFPDSVEQEIWGMTVTADKYDGEDGVSRRVSFMKDDYGYRFDLTATGNPEDAEKLVSRIVSWIAIRDGLDLAPFTGEETPEPDWDTESQPPSPPSQDEASSQGEASAPSVPPAASVPPVDGDEASSPAWYPEGVEVLPPEETNEN